MKSSLLRLLILSSILFTSCVSTKTFLKNDQIPSDFGKGNKGILIVPSGNKSVDKAVASAFEKYYKGNYEIGEPSASNKKNGAKPRYTFNIYRDYNAGTFTAAGRQGPSTDTYFGITDLETNKTYKNLRYGNYNKFSRLFVQALEIVRSQNQ